MDTQIADEFERALVHTVISLAKKSGLNFAQFAKQAYGDNDSSIRKWRKQRREEKPQAFTISDLFLCAEALSEEPENIVYQTNARRKANE